MLRSSAGSIWLEGEEITRMRPDQRVRRGLARTFQINTLFPQLTPLEAVTTRSANGTATGSACSSGASSG